MGISGSFPQGKPAATLALPNLQSLLAKVILKKEFHFIHIYREQNTFFPTHLFAQPSDPLFSSLPNAAEAFSFPGEKKIL